MRMRCLLLLALGSTGCLFLPAIDDDGYVACVDDDDCAAGRSCIADFQRCAPPPWNDANFENRRALIVTNPSGVELPAGAAIPVPFGGVDDVLPLDQFGPDSRFAQFARQSPQDDGSWSVVGVYRDLAQGRGLDDDTFVIWIPLARALPAGGSDALAFLEQGTEAGTPTVVEDPLTAFALFDDLDAFDVDGDELVNEGVFVDAPGTAAPLQGESQVNIGDNTKVVWRAGLEPPLSVTFRARINLLTCREVFMGLTSSASSSFEVPSAGFFVDTDLLAVAEIAPGAGDTPQGLSAPTLINESPTELHRFTVTVDDNAVRLLVDDVVFDERSDLQPGFDAVKLLPTIEVGGDCSVDVDAVWLSPLPTKTPTVVAEDELLFNPTFD
ncbi:MAG: hypothetical protein Q8O67_33425 [Deltaproteobacteria bacterium]|nr:hypothetical protein [Deltaproteobacteria bacterium]